MPRYSVKCLLGLVAAVAAGCAVLVRPSDLAALVVAFTLPLALTTATAGALFSRGTTRAFMAGFGIAAWTYFILCSTICEPTPIMMEQPIDIHFPYGLVDRVYAVIHLPSAGREFDPKRLPPVQQLGAAP